MTVALVSFRTSTYTQWPLLEGSLAFQGNVFSVLLLKTTHQVYVFSTKKSLPDVQNSDTKSLRYSETEALILGVF